MRKNKIVGRLAGFSVLTALITMLMTSSAFAQEHVCIELLVGAGYAAKLELHVGTLKKIETGPFPIGQQRCVKISDAAPEGTTLDAGTRIVTKLNAILGKTVECTPSPTYYDPSRTDNIVFSATGATWNPVCSQVR